MKGKITISREFCKGGEICVSFCPQKILSLSRELNSSGSFTADAEKPKNAPAAPSARGYARGRRSRYTVPKILMDGNPAIGEAAIRAGCQCYFGYPTVEPLAKNWLHLFRDEIYPCSKKGKILACRFAGSPPLSQGRGGGHPEGEEDGSRES